MGGGLKENTFPRSSSEFFGGSERSLWGFVDRYKIRDGVYVIGRHHSPKLPWSDKDLQGYADKANDKLNPIKVIILFACNASIPNPLACVAPPPGLLTKLEKAFNSSKKDIPVLSQAKNCELSDAHKLSLLAPNTFVLAAGNFFWASGVIAPTNADTEKRKVTWKNSTQKDLNTGPNIKKEEGFHVYKNGQLVYVPLHLIMQGLGPKKLSK